MTDRELLELAAKAANLGDCWFDEFHDDYVVYHQDIDCNCSWNPLEDDGDALRLAVKLRIPMHFRVTDCFGSRESSTVCGELIDARNSERYENKVAHNGDDCAATRRAIVRAAASIGEQMK